MGSSREHGRARVGMLLAGACLLACAGGYNRQPGGASVQQRVVTPQGQPARLHLASLRRQQPVAAAPLSTAEVDDLYQDKCSLCHGADRTGKPPAFPTLIGVTGKYNDAEITRQIRQGKGRMPAFPGLTDDEVKALIAFLKTPPAPAGTPTETVPPPPLPASFSLGRSWMAGS